MEIGKNMTFNILTEISYIRDKSFFELHNYEATLVDSDVVNDISMDMTIVFLIPKRDSNENR